MQIDPAESLKQHARLLALAARWREHLVDCPGRQLQEAVATYLRDRMAAHESALRHGDEDECDEREMLSERLLAGLRRANHLEDINHRLDEFYERKPDVEASDELDHLRRENELMRSLDVRLSLPQFGLPGLDELLARWEALDPRGIHYHGLDDGLARTLAAMAPIAEAWLALAAGIADPETYAPFAPPGAAASGP
ncbi:hypothetical protein ACFPYM_03395, partial [Methylobacterium hispanicum]